MTNFQKQFQGKTVVVTGHTGFKGSWLTAWLLELGARVIGLSDGVPTTPAHFNVARLEPRIQHHLADIRDAKAVADIITKAQPDFVFHLAAQALVRRSYADPLTTFHTNTMGTAHVLEALRQLKKPCIAVLITSDKCYDNVEWLWGYRETDRLGGKDPYSASKAAAELVIHSYVESFMRDNTVVRVGVGRAGNVIGGGDWAADRLVPDCMRAWSTGQRVPVRNPAATRPWQHVLEPLSGYLTLACALADSPALHGEAFNFGPRAEQDNSVEALLDALIREWPGAAWDNTSGGATAQREAGLLKLNCDKAAHYLDWAPTLDFTQTVGLTADWYRRYYATPEASMADTTLKQLHAYIEAAQARGMAWTR